MAGQGVTCAHCHVFNGRKRSIRCVGCENSFHLSCVGLTRNQASSLERWSCDSCRGIATAPADRVEQVLDLEVIVLKCRNNYRVLNRIPKGAIRQVGDALNDILKIVIEKCTPVAWSRLICFSYWFLRVPDRERNGHSTSLATKVKKQVADFIALGSMPNLPPITCLLYTSPSPRDKRQSRMPSSA